MIDYGNSHPVKCTITVDDNDARIVAENAELMREIVRACANGSDYSKPGTPDTVGITFLDLHGEVVPKGDIERLEQLVHLLDVMGRLTIVDIEPGHLPRPTWITIKGGKDYTDVAYGLIDSIANGYLRAA